MNTTTSCLDFLRYSIDVNYALPEIINNVDWNRMLIWAEQQSIIGILFGGIRKADKSLNIPYEVLLEWIGNANIIENRNKLLDERCYEVGKLFEEQGFEYCILKGQGNALLYPEPSLRTPGDVDIWLNIGNPKACDHSVKEIIRRVRLVNPHGRAEYHHIDYGDYNGVEVEVHYRPSFSNNLIYDRRLQKWFNARAGHQFAHIVAIPGNAGSICVPTFEFNVVFLLSHIYRHLLQEGIGLRQMIDYYYLLKSNTNRPNDMNYNEILRYLGLKKIAGAVMWVLHEKLGLDKKYLIAPMDAKRGELLLNEILRGGNFGHYDTVNRTASTRFKKNVQRIKRDFRMARYFPSECLWEPVFRVYHFIWRLKYN